MSPTRKIAFALAPVVLLWILVEGGLRLAGVASSLEREDPFVGFEARLPLFVADRDADGTPILRTADNKLRFFNAQRFQRDKARDARRVFCLGGSTTYGRPYGDATSFCGWLRATLPVVEPDRSWEVVNAGGISYASYRVASLVQEIAAYEPDLLVVYTGQNEFLEERTYRSVRRMPDWLRWLDAELRGLRSYSLLESWLARLRRGDAVGSRDELAAEVRTRLDSSVGLDAYVRDDALAVHVIDHFRLNLDRIVRMGRNAGAEVLVVVPADNLRDCAPFKSQPSDGLSEAELARLLAAVDTGRAAARAGDTGRARRLLEEAARLDPRYALGRYELGRVLLDLGEREAALRELSAARDEDVCPLRARSEIVTATREAVSRLRTPAVDFPELIRRLDPEAPPRGADWFLDHVHPTIEGHRLLAREILAELHRAGWLAADPETRGDEIARAERALLEGVDHRAHGVALRNLAKVLSWAGKTEEAGRAATLALERLGDDAESLFILSIDASERGDHPRAIALLRESLRLDPEWVKPRLNLGVELARTGRYDEARQAYDEVLRLAPEHPSVRFNLARLLERQGRVHEAADLYRESLALYPDDADARAELAQLETLLAERSAAPAVRP